jgi:hypothetical protein
MDRQKKTKKLSQRGRQRMREGDKESRKETERGRQRMRD